MDNETLTEETIKAEAAGDTRRLRELERAKRRGTLDELEPKYASDGSPGEELEARLKQAEMTAQATGSDEFAQELRDIREASEPSEALRREIRVAKGAGMEDEAALLERLAGGE